MLVVPGAAGTRPTERYHQAKFRAELEAAVEQAKTPKGDRPPQQPGALSLAFQTFFADFRFQFSRILGHGRKTSC